MPIFDTIGSLAAAPFAASTRGLEALRRLSNRTMAVILTHPGPRAAISPSNWLLTLPNVRGGYTVYDKDWAVRYSIIFDPLWQQRYDDFGPDVEIPEFHFGYDTEDQSFFSTLRVSDYFYVVYDSRLRSGSDYKTVVLIVACTDDETAENTGSSRRV